MLPIFTLLACGSHYLLHQYKQGLIKVHEMNKLRILNEGGHHLANHLIGQISVALKIARDKTKVPAYIKNEHGVLVTQFLFDHIVAYTTDSINFPIDLQFSSHLFQDIGFLSIIHPVKDLGLPVSIDICLAFYNLGASVLEYTIRVPYSIAPQNILSISNDYMIDKLAEANADFSISHIIGKGASSQNLSVNKVKALARDGVNFFELDRYNILKIITRLGIESIKPLSEVGADFSKLKDLALKLIVEKELSASKDLASEVREKVSESNEISLDKSIICDENKGFNYADICYENDILENRLSCGHLANLSEDFLSI